MKKRPAFIWVFIILLIVLFTQFRLELNAKQEEKSVGLNMEWLQYTPEPVKKYFKERESEGGLHTFQYEGKTYLYLNNPLRMISSIHKKEGDFIVITNRDKGYHDHPVYITVIKEYPEKGFLVNAH